MPHYGTEKLHLDLKEQLQQSNIKIGRDKFLSFCRAHQLLVHRTKRFHITTNSNHKFFKCPNLIKNFTPTHSEQVFVSDISYVRIQNKHAYMALVTDLYSKKIMGYKLDDNMKTTLVKDALKMAMKNKQHNKYQTIHHSDRGIQYCFPDFTEFAKDHNFLLSTTENSDPYENAVAERINKTLKYEFGLGKNLPSLQVAQKMLHQAAFLYNNKRRHISLNMKTPDQAHSDQTHKYKSYKRKEKQEY